MNQEPESNANIQKFALSKNFTIGGVGHMFAKTNVNKQCTEPESSCTPTSKLCCPSNQGVWTYLKSVSAVPSNGKIPWNFEKYLVGKDGVPLSRTGASADPAADEAAIDALLAGNY